MLDVFRPRYRMECAWELDTPLYELLVLTYYNLSMRHQVCYRSYKETDAMFLGVCALGLSGFTAIPYMF